MATSRLDWTREEIILAMDLYMGSGALGGGSIPGKASAAVLGLSELLHQLNAYPPSQQGDRYRNPEGVYLKLTNLRAIETDGRHGMNAFSQLDAAVWREYIEDPRALREEAEAIRRRLTDGALDVASPDPRVVDVPVERHNTEWYLSHPSGEPRENERAEQRSSSVTRPGWRRRTSLCSGAGTRRRARCARSIATPGFPHEISSSRQRTVTVAPTFGSQLDSCMTTGGFTTCRLC